MNLRQATEDARLSPALQRVAWLPAAAGLAVVVITGAMLFSTYYGDPSIYLPYAKNLAHGDFFRFDPGGAVSSGIASPLWVLVLAVPFALGAGAAAAKILALVATAAAYVLVVYAAARLTRSMLAAGIAALYVAGALAIWGTMAYDSALVVGLVALSLVAADRVQRRFERDGSVSFGAAWPLALVLGLFPLTRPDMALFVPFLLGSLWLFGPLRAGRDLRLVLGMTAMCLIPAAAYYLYAIAETGSISVSSQTRTYDQKQQAEHAGGVLYSGEALSYLRSIAIALLGAAAGAVGLWRGGRLRWVAAYMILGVVAYAVALVFYPVTTYVERYFLPVAPLVAVALAAALSQLSGRRLAAGAAILLVVLGSWALRPLRTAAQDRDRGYSFNEITEKQGVGYVNRVAPHGAHVLGYEVQDRWQMRDDLSLLALNGIIDGRVFGYRDRGDMRGFLLRYRPAYWLANDATAQLAFTRHSLLGIAYGRMRRLPVGASVTVEGIRFEVAERRRRPVPLGFAGWRYIVKLGYPAA